MSDTEDITPDQLPGIFLYGAHKLRLDENGLAPGHDPADLQTIGALCVLISRLTADENTPFDGTISGLAVLAGALIAAHDAGQPVPELVPRWHAALADAVQLFGEG